MDTIQLTEKHAALKRLLDSKQFSKAKKVSHFLEFICEQSFQGNADKLNEYMIGVEVYERGADFDPQNDAIVRVQAHEIRRRLKEYYDEKGQDEPLRVHIPSGHYVPVFSRTEPLAEITVAAQPAVDITTPAPRFIRRHAVVILLSCLCALFASLWVGERYFTRHPSIQDSSTLPESMEWFWGPFMPPASPPLIVIPNHPLLRAAHEGDTPATLAQSTLIPKEKLPSFRDTIHFRELKGFYFVPSLTDFTAVGEALGLLNFYDLFTRVGQKVLVKESRLVDYEMVRRGNAILLGGNQAWSGRIFLYPDGFWFHAGLITNKSPQPGELPVYKPEFDPITNSLRKDYALVLMLANENRNQRILLIYGIYTQGSQAAIEYVTSEQRLLEVRKALMDLSADKNMTPRYFQILLQTTVENYVPGNVTLVGVRIIPDGLATGTQSH